MGFRRATSFTRFDTKNPRTKDSERILVLNGVLERCDAVFKLLLKRRFPMVASVVFDLMKDLDPTLRQSDVTYALKKLVSYGVVACFRKDYISENYSLTPSVYYEVEYPEWDARKWYAIRREARKTLGR